jgi:hypothetical protein
MIERWSNVPCASASHAIPRATTRNSTRNAGPGRMRVAASVASSPSAINSTHQAAPGAMRTTLFPGGVSALPAAAAANATTTTPARAASSRTRASPTPSATAATASSVA